MKWAAQRNIHISIKGTGHDMNGPRTLLVIRVADPYRSSGAYSLSICTRNFNAIKHHHVW